MRLIALALLCPSLAFGLTCPGKLKRSTLPISPKDREYLLTMMTHSYGPDAAAFAPDVTAAVSEVHYLDAKTNPVVSRFSVTYKTKKTADRAFEHMKRRWQKPEFQRISRSGNTVVFLGNNKMTAECFAAFR